MADIDINYLKEKSLLPKDSEIISDHNNIITMSKSERLVARIALLSVIKKRTTPGDLLYSHALSWDMRDQDVVVAPISRSPIVDGDTIISMYPLLDPVDWNLMSSNSVYGKVSRLAKLGNVLSKETAEQLYDLDISSYAHTRLSQAQTENNSDDLTRLTDVVERQIEFYDQHYPFSELSNDDPALVHGDLHTGNIVSRQTNPLLIDLDSLSMGPRLYDLASWHVRSMRGEDVPTHEMIEIEKNNHGWNQESFNALMGWKVISSLTHILRYESASSRPSSIKNLTKLATVANIPGVLNDV